MTPDVNTPSRTVRPPFRLFDPFSAGLLRFQPNGSSTAPVPTPVATEFNPGERWYYIIILFLPSIRNFGSLELGAIVAEFAELASDSDCRRLRCAVAAERSEGRATHRERGDSRAKRVPSDNRQSSAVCAPPRLAAGWSSGRRQAGPGQGVDSSQCSAASNQQPAEAGAEAGEVAGG